MGSERASSNVQGYGKGVFKRIAERVRDKRLELVGPVLRRFLRAQKAYRNIYRRISKTTDSPFFFRDDIYEGVFAWGLKEPSGSVVMWILYVSAQEWYLTPSKVPSKVRKVQEVYRRLYTPNARVYMAIMARRSTSGAQNSAKNQGVPIRTPEQVDEDIKKLFEKRYYNFLASLRGKRVFGPLAAELYVLQLIAEEWVGPMIPKVFADEFEVYRCIDEGCTVPSDIGPPPGGG